jgi:hypothetical protein
MRRRASSRRRRLTRLRATAECLKRGTTNPTRVQEVSPSVSPSLTGCTRGEVATRTSMCSVRMRFPSRAMRCNSAPRVIRAARGKPSDAPGVLCSGVLVRNTNGQLLTTLLTPTGQRCTTPLRFHARTESVRLEPARVARAVGWLPHDSSTVRSDRTSVQTGKPNHHSKIGQAASDFSACGTKAACFTRPMPICFFHIGEIASLPRLPKFSTSLP